MSLPQAEIDHQLSDPHGFSCSGLNAYTIAGMIIVTVAVFLRLWSRKIAKIEWKSDDYTLLVALVLSLGAQACSLNTTINGGLCRHSLFISDARNVQSGKSAWAWSILYTTAYPIARISLVLLYRRIFVKQWFRAMCWFLIFCYAGYAIGSMIADFCGVLPVNSVWNRKVKVTKSIDTKKLYLANSGFNIATDAILLIMPLVIVWGSGMKTWLYKLGLSVVFSLGVLTLIASIMRLVEYYRYNTLDSSFGFAKPQWWTITEINLGLLCPCLVTFGPVIRAGYILFLSRLPHERRRQIERFTGVRSTHHHATQSENSKFEIGEDSLNGSSTTEVPSTLHSKQSQLEAGTLGAGEKTASAMVPTERERIETDQVRKE